ncbi:Uncharacterised protein [Bordetella pertussis]|nr:Uncharacterised protein [Bordetella pertussis]
MVMSMPGKCADSHSLRCDDLLIWSSTRLTDSTPPATIAGTPSVRIRPAAIAIACRPELQARCTVMPETVTGMPARSALNRATFLPVPPSG